MCWSVESSLPVASLMLVEGALSAVLRLLAVFSREGGVSYTPSCHWGVQLLIVRIVLQWVALSLLWLTSARSVSVLSVWSLSLVLDHDLLVSVEELWTVSLLRSIPLINGAGGLLEVSLTQILSLFNFLLYGVNAGSSLVAVSILEIPSLLRLW